MRASCFLLGLLLPLAAVVAGCHSADENTATPPADPAALADTIDAVGTKKMRTVLHALNEQAYARPMNYFHLNGRRAEVLKNQLDTAGTDAATRLRYRPCRVDF